MRPWCLSSAGPPLFQRWRSFPPQRGFRKRLPAIMIIIKHMNLQVGDTIGDYEILAVLGTGGMGRVFRVRNLISDRIDAMKVVLPGLVTDAGIADRFLREIKLHASLVHPNIAGLHTALHYRESYLMIMELVEGRSLDEMIRSGPLETARGVDIVQQVLAALSHAHSHGVIHRDIKPANIIVRDDGVVKVTDFGIARASGTPQLTAAGLVLGSLHYMSPEQIKAQPVGSAFGPLLGWSHVV